MKQRKGRQEDNKKYFNCENANLRESIDLFKHSISHGEKNLDLDKCWYLNKPKNGSPKPDGEEGFVTNFQLLFDRALSIASKSERTILGFFYGNAYRQPSRSIHLNIGGVGIKVSSNFIKARRDQLILLAIHCLKRCRQLTRIRTSKGFGAQIARILAKLSKSKNAYSQVTRPEIKKGDIVTVFNSLGEVISIKKSRYGYRSFKICYLSNPPLDEKEDWFSALDVTKFIDGKKLRNNVINLLRSWGAIPPSSRRIREAMRKTALEAWQKFIA